MSGRFTVVRRTCCDCRKTYGWSVWRWSGEWTATSHGICPSCLRHALATPVQPRLGEVSTA